MLYTVMVQVTDEEGAAVEAQMTLRDTDEHWRKDISDPFNAAAATACHVYDLISSVKEKLGTP